MFVLRTNQAQVSGVIWGVRPVFTAEISSIEAALNELAQA